MITISFLGLRACPVLFEKVALHSTSRALTPSRSSHLPLRHANLNDTYYTREAESKMYFDYTSDEDSSQSESEMSSLVPTIRQDTSEEDTQEDIELFPHPTTLSASDLDDSPKNIYQYRPLRAQSTIRLIQVMPDRIWGEIACKVYTFDIQQQPDIKYEALSYVWGNPRKSWEVYLADDGNDQWYSYPLHENLQRFLVYAWQQKMFDRLFWTDYLCLDQNDPDEIAEQIPRMGSIFSNAEQTIIWLQLDECEQKGLQRIAELPREVSRYELWVIFRSPFFSHEYWRRVWIVQEVAMAKKVCLISGKISVDFDDLWPRLYRHLNKYWGLFGPHRLVSRVRRLHALRQTSGRVPLWSLLHDFHHSLYSCSRPADRVYGFLGMVADHDDGTSPVENLKINYKRSLRNIWLDVLFESWPPWKQLLSIMKGPMQRASVLECNWQSLVRYLGSSWTSKRHKELAAITLDVFFALRAVKQVFREPHIVTRAFYIDPFGFLHRVISDMKVDFRLTIQQVAAVLALGVQNMFQGPAYGAPPQWRCASHRHAREESRYTLGHTKVANGFGELDDYGLGIVAVACEKHSKSCDGSTIVFEMPNIGFRMSIEQDPENIYSFFHLQLEDRRSA